MTMITNVQDLHLKLRRPNDQKYFPYKHQLAPPSVFKILFFIKFYVVVSFLVFELI